MRGVGVGRVYGGARSGAEVGKWAVVGWFGCGTLCCSCVARGGPPSQHPCIHRSRTRSMYTQYVRHLHMHAVRQPRTYTRGHVCMHAGPRRCVCCAPWRRRRGRWRRVRQAERVRCYRPLMGGRRPEGVGLGRREPKVPKSVAETRAGWVARRGAERGGRGRYQNLLLHLLLHQGGAQQRCRCRRWRILLVLHVPKKVLARVQVKVPKVRHGGSTCRRRKRHCHQRPAAGVVAAGPLGPVASALADCRAPLRSGSRVQHGPRFPCCAPALR